MLRSMTGYARKVVELPIGHGSIEIHSINRKGLDFHIHLPKELLCFDIEIRKWLSSKLERGQITVRLVISHLISYGTPRFKQMKQEWEKVCRELDWDPCQVTLPFLTQQSASALLSLSSEEEQQIRLILKNSFDEAIEELVKMKEKEGSHLVYDLQERLNVIQTQVDRIEKIKEGLTTHFRNRIQEKLEEIGFLDDELKVRVAKEVALLAEKSDVTEEIVRLRAHIAQMNEHLSGKVLSVGRTLDFLSQEMHREVNTIGSKSVDREMTAFVLTIKGELDRMREQIQNIE